MCNCICTIVSVQLYLYNRICTIVSVQLYLYNCICTTVSVQLYLYNCICTTVSVQLYLYNCICTIVSVQSYLYNCICTTVSVQLYLYNCICTIVSVQLYLYNCICTIVSVQSYLYNCICIYSSSLGVGLATITLQQNLTIDARCTYGVNLVIGTSGGLPSNILIDSIAYFPNYLYSARYLEASMSAVEHLGYQALLASCTFRNTCQLVMNFDISVHNINLQFA